MPDNDQNEDKPSRRASDWKIRFGLSVLVVCLAMIGAMVYLFWVMPDAMIGPKQPVPFSHRVHAGVKGINCRFCHPFAERGKNAGLPSVEKCMFCHKHVIPLNPWLTVEREHYASGIPVIWNRVFFVPDYVKFRHQPHVKWAKVDCDHCHWPVETLDRLKTKHFGMGFCVSCHRSHHAITDCYLSCHH
ncbi:MAG: cytochrome c3 family protein [Syntrophobacteraceae bacterium]